MIYSVDTILSLVLLSILFSLGSSRLTVLFKVIAFQGVVVSIVPLIIGGREFGWGDITFTLATMTVRGIVIPFCIYFAIKKATIETKFRPIVGYNASMMGGLIFIVMAAVVGGKLHLPAVSEGKLLFPAAVTLLVAGMFLLMARRNAIAMVLGYIMMENGIYLVGTTFSVQARHIVEFGILLDILAGVMIMAVILQNIKQAFDDMDTARLRTLKE
ncbi:MAG: hydrogenase [Proteobacteria bacterium]|nr:hydrogenase [Pseudomonadota bacterium]